MERQIIIDAIIDNDITNVISFSGGNFALSLIYIISYLVISVIFAI